MQLLGAILYDPAVAVSKATSGLLAMTAVDTTNLRQTVTVPAHGMLSIRLATVITGATTVPTILLGVMNGATVVGRVNPVDFPGTMNAATQSTPCVAEFIVTGLTPGSITLDAAYAVQVVVASTNVKYGGPNNASGADAWGAFCFEIWDPKPFTFTTASKIDASVRDWVGDAIPARSVTGVPKVDVADWLGSAPNALQSGRVDSYLGAVASGVIAAAGFAAGALDAVWSTAARVLTAGTNIVLAKGTGVTGFNDLDAAGVRTATGLASANLDTQLSAIKSDTGTTLTDVNTGAGAIYTRLGAPAGASLAADVAAVKSDTGPALTDAIAIKAKTDNLPAAPAATSDIPTANQNADALLDRTAGVETGLTPRQCFRLAAAALFGRANGLATTTVHYRDTTDSKNRITATVDADGNRSSLALDPS